MEIVSGLPAVSGAIRSLMIVLVKDKAFEDPNKVKTWHQHADNSGKVIFVVGRFFSPAPGPGRDEKWK